MITDTTIDRNGKLAVVGAGSWGTAASIALSDNFSRVDLWAHHETDIERIKRERENAAFLPGFEMPRNVEPSHDLERVVSGAPIVLFCVPTQFTREVAREASIFLGEGQVVVSLSKGIETSSLKRVSEILMEEFPGEVGVDVSVLSGPTFAREVAAYKPAAATVASRDISVARMLQERLSTPLFRLYADTDITGVEVGGAVKNVIAIATGIADGLDYGLNARAAIITRGLVEMKRLGSALGAERATLNGLAGLGDLILTCTGDLSRNRTFGIRIGRGEAAEDIQGSMLMVVEGVKSSRSVFELGVREEVEMPIVEQVYHILYEGKKASDAVEDLLGRSLKLEKDRAEFLWKDWN